MAVHQCARYSVSPKLSHERTVKRIDRYLLGTQDRGIAFKPDDSNGLVCYVDADFAGGWDKENPDDPEQDMWSFMLDSLWYGQVECKPKLLYPQKSRNKLHYRWQCAKYSA